MAEADSRTAGGVLAVASAPTSARVPRTRLARISSLYAAVQRRPPTLAPARWTTASRPSRAPGANPPVGASGSQAISSSLAGAWRTSLTTRWPLPRRLATRALPIRPDDPVTAILSAPMAGVLDACSDRSEPEFGFELTFLQPVLHGGQEAGSVGSVDEPVVVGEREVDHRADGDHLAERGVLHHHRPLHHRAGAQDRHLRLVDDGRVEQRPPAAGVGQREGAARQVVR